ncbi:MAG: hypothetical protein KME26_21200 [Oscillatoria princeps RMCB-10]|jgi:hypothetical protein|nr:hypothetical protein [Oscillatoria princeps RMCB-10]
MSGQCFIETDGYQIWFDLKSVDSQKKYIDAVVEFRSDPRLCEVSVKSAPTFLAVSDLPELVMYLNRHIARLQTDPDSESDTLVTWELGFQVQASSGEVRSPTDGEFGIRFMVNLGRSHEEASSLFVGGEAEVTLEQVKSFTSSLQAALAELGSGELERQSR